MTRIAGIPQQLRGVAGTLHATAGDLQAFAEALAAISYPEMPPDTAATVEALVVDAGGRLRRDAIVADSAGGAIKNRAAWFEFADALLAQPVLRGVHESTEGLVNALNVVEARRVTQMLSEWDRWNRLVIPIVNEYDAESGAATSIWFLFQQRSPLPFDRFQSMLAGAGDAEAYAAGADVPLAVLRGVAGKFLGPFGIVTNGVTVFAPPHSGWRGDVDRVSGGVGVVGSLGATALAFGAATPGLDIAVGSVLLGVAAWQVGNLVYDNRKAIARAAVATGKYAYEHAGWIGGPLGQLAWEHRAGIAHAAVSAGEWGVDHAVAVAKSGLSIGEGAVHDVTHPLDTAKKIGQGLDEVAGALGI